jgi:hypothetical protein
MFCFMLAFWGKTQNQTSAHAWKLLRCELAHFAQGATAEKVNMHTF